MSKELLYFQKKLLNDQLLVLECFLHQLSRFDRRFPLQTLPANLPVNCSIFNLALNDLQESSDVRRMSVDYAMDLLRTAEYHPNEQIRNFDLEVINK